MPFSTHYRITVDGGSHNNHDVTIPSEAYGSYLLETAKNQRMERHEFGEITSNAAEFTAVITAIKDLQRVILSAGKTLGDYTVTIRMDSRLVIGSQGAWKGMKPFKIKKSHLVPLNIELKTLLSAFSSITWEKLPRAEIEAVLGH